jgi:hypothetical protein
VAGNAEIQRKLNEGVEAAKAGDRSTARRLLEEVVEQDERNELAWIWLATVATGASERREHLRRVLAINPRNQRAREALARLGEDPTTSRPGTGPTPTLEETVRRTDALAQRPRRGASTGLIFVIAAAAFLLAGLGIIVVSSGVLDTVDPTPTRIVAQQGVATDSPTTTPTTAPSSTPVPLDEITRNAPTLPPQPTTTATPTPTPTLAVTPPLELDAFEVFYISQDPAVPEPSLFNVLADGSGGGLIEDRIRDIDFAADGFTFVFVRDIANESGVRLPEIFIATLANPADATQLTQLGAPDTASPSFSPDGTRVIFSSSNGRPAPDLWVVSAEGGDPTQVTDTAASEREPSWSPSGGQIAFTSDLGAVGSTEIFLLNVTDAGAPLGSALQATNADRSSYAPSWSPDGRTVVFASDRTGDGDLFTMDSQGNNEQLLTIDDNGAEDRRPAFSPDGRWVVYVSNRDDGTFQTFVMRTNGTGVRRLTANQRVDISAVFRPHEVNE